MIRPCEAEVIHSTLNAINLPITVEGLNNKTRFTTSQESALTLKHYLVCPPKTFSKINICFTTTCFSSLCLCFICLDDILGLFWMVSEKTQFRYKNHLFWLVSACKFLIQFINPQGLGPGSYRRAASQPLGGHIKLLISFVSERRTWGVTGVSG